MKIYENLTKDLSQVKQETCHYERFFSVEEGDVILDIGAHVGEFSKRHIDKASKIFAMEPDPIFYKNFPKAENIYLIKAAIAEETGQSKLISNGSANSLNDKEGIEVLTQNIQSILKATGKVNFLKIDCEGGEYSIFTKKFIPVIKQNVDKIAAELHIHNEEQRTYLPHMFYLLEKNNLSYILTSIDGKILSKEQFLSNLNYYTEVYLYIKTNEEIEIPETITVNYVKGCNINIEGGNGEYLVKFKDGKDIKYETIIHGNSWAKCNFEYFIPWSVEVWKKGKLIFHRTLNLKEKRVFISLESKSLGDTLAWVPYVEEFRKKHDCHVICSTFHNYLFEKEYPEIEFTQPGQVAHNIIAQYPIGWFYNGEIINTWRNPKDPKPFPLQQTATDILGLEFKEIKPKITLSDVPKTKDVGIGFHSTCQAKYWNNPTGWQEVTDYIKSCGYNPIILSKEENGYMGNFFPEGIDHQGDFSGIKLVEKLCSLSAFVGIGSGLSWLAWACNIPTIIISGFSRPITEQSSCDRIFVPQTRNPICNGCFNSYKLNPGDWNWCPINKGTDRQFECSKKIDSQQVIDKLKKYVYLPTSIPMYNESSNEM